MTTSSRVTQMAEAGERFRALAHAAAQRTTERPRVVLQAAITKETGQVRDDDLMVALVPAWRRLLLELIRDPDFLDHAGPRIVNTLIAATYERDGWDGVRLTSCGADEECELLVARRGFGSVRFIDRVKLCAPGGMVTANDIHGLLSALHAMPAVSTGVVSSTGDFAPGIRNDLVVKPFPPARLALRNRVDLLAWLKSAVASIQDETLGASVAPADS